MSMPAIKIIFFLCLSILQVSAQDQPGLVPSTGATTPDNFSPPASSLSSEQQCVLIQLAGSFYNVAKYATVDIDSGMSAAVHSLGLSLLPVMTEGIETKIPASLSDWVAREQLAEGKNKLPALTGLAHLQELYLVGAWYAYRTNVERPSMDSAIGYLKRAIAESNMLHSGDWRRQSEDLMGKASLEKGDTATGNQLFRQLIDECRQAKDAPGEAKAWRNWAMYFMFSPATGPERKGRYGDNLRNALRSVKSSAITRDSLGWAHFYMRLANIYYDQPGSEAEAFEWMSKAVHRYLRTGGDLFLYQYLASFIWNVSSDSQVKEAHDLLEKVHQLYPPNNPVDLLYYYTELCYYYDEINDIASLKRYALLLFHQEKLAAPLRPQLQGIGESALARVYFLEGKFKESERLYRSFLKSNAGMSEILAQHRALFLLLKIDSALGHTTAELADYRQELILRDSIYNTTHVRQLETMKVQYETAERDKDIQLLNSQNLLQESQLKQAAFVRKISFAGILLLLVVVGLVFSRYRIKQKQKTQIDEKNAQLNELIVEKDGLLDTKEWLLKELHHRVKNNLQVMMSLQELQARNLITEEALTAVHDGSNRLYAMSLIHQKLYQQDGAGQIDMHQYIGELVRHLSDAFASANPVKIETDLRTDIELSATQAIPVGLILNEAITNVFKYAFVGRPVNGIAAAPLLRISLVRTVRNGEIELTIKDNGRGYTGQTKDNTRKSLGLSLMNALAEELDGDLQMVNDAGLTILLRFTPVLI